jgi:hypothetical protein
MLTELNCSVTFEEIDKDSIDLNSLESFIGHEDTARVLCVSFNRKFAKLEKGETFLIAQLMGGRLPEGCKILPEGFSFKFIKGKIN